MNPVTHSPALTLNVSEHDNARDLNLALSVAPIFRLEPEQARQTVAQLSHITSQWRTIAARVACSELVARGLLHDEGIGRWDTAVMTYFVATDLAAWLAEWLKQK